MAKAMFIVDVQHAQFFGPWAMPESPELLHRIGNRLLEARQAGNAVFHIQDDGPEGELDGPGMPFWQLVFAPASGERVVRKSSPNVFDDNPYLDAELRHAGISLVEFVGVQSEVCLRSSALGAKELGYQIQLDISLHGTFDSETESHEQISKRVQMELTGE
jgi:nicotinamidase-related amidase